MPATAAMPFIVVLNALYVEVAAALAGWTTSQGASVKVRPARHRNSRDDEWYCVALRYVSADPSNVGREESTNGMPEEMWELAVNLQIDGPLPAEGTDPYGPDDEAPTGFEPHAEIIARILDRLFPESDVYVENTLGGTVWQIRYDGTADDDDADRSPDLVRMEERLTLFYRVRADRPMTLLMGS